MPPEIKLRIEQELFLRSFFLSPPPTRVARQLASRMVTSQLRKGDVLFRRGEPAGGLHMIVDGEISMEAPGEVPWLFQEGAMIGVGDAILDRDHVRTARAVGRAQVVSIGFDEYSETLEDNFAFAKVSLERAITSIHDQALEAAPQVFDSADLGCAECTWSGRLNTIERLLVLRSLRVLTDGPVQPLVDLAKLSQQTDYAAGDVILRRQELVTELFVLVNGRVRVSRSEPDVDAVFAPGSIIGGPVMLGSQRSLYDLEALEDVSVLRLSKEDIFDVMEDQYTLATKFFGWVALDNIRTRSLLAEQRGEKLSELSQGSSPATAASG